MSTQQPEDSTAAEHVEKKHPAPGEAPLLSDKVAQLLVKAKPAFKQIAASLEKVEPLVDRAVMESKKVWVKLQPYHVDELLPLLLGVAMILCGGYFPTILFSIEAIRVSGSFPGIQSSFKALRSNYLAAKTASEKDDKIDSNRDGVPDVKQQEPGALLHRKALLLLKSINSEQVSDAAQKLSTALFAVLATLRLRLGAALTIGTSLSDVASTWGTGTVTDAVSKSLPDEARRLAPLIVSGALRALGFMLAWVFARPVGAIYAALRGAQIVLDCFIDYSQRNGSLSKDSWVLHQKQYAGVALAFAGFAFQWFYSFQPPFLLRLLLCPVSLVEMLASFTFGIFA